MCETGAGRPVGAPHVTRPPRCRARCHATTSARWRRHSRCTHGEQPLIAVQAGVVRKVLHPSCTPASPGVCCARSGSPRRWRPVREIRLPARFTAIDAVLPCTRHIHGIALDDMGTWISSAHAFQHHIAIQRPRTRVIVRTLTDTPCYTCAHAFVRARVSPQVPRHH